MKCTNDLDMVKALAKVTYLSFFVGSAEFSILSWYSSKLKKSLIFFGFITDLSIHSNAGVMYGSSIVKNISLID